MSIEAHAQIDGWSLSIRLIPTLHNNDNEMVLADIVAGDIFAETRNLALSHGQGVDYLLHLGTLGTSSATRYLGEFLRGQSVEWTHTQLLKADAWFHDHLAEFPAPPPPTPGYFDDKRWAYWSAREFLEACVRGGYGISFS